MQLVKGQCLWPAGLIWSHILPIMPWDFYFILFFSQSSMLSGVPSYHLVDAGKVSPGMGAWASLVAKTTEPLLLKELVTMETAVPISSLGMLDDMFVELWVWGSSVKLPKKDGEAGGKKEVWGELELSLCRENWGTLGPIFMPGMNIKIVSDQLPFHVHSGRNRRKWIKASEWGMQLYQS